MALFSHAYSGNLPRCRRHVWREHSSAILVTTFFLFSCWRVGNGRGGGSLFIIVACCYDLLWFWAACWVLLGALSGLALYPGCLAADVEIFLSIIQLSLREKTILECYLPMSVLESAPLAESAMPATYGSIPRAICAIFFSNSST